MTKEFHRNDAELGLCWYFVKVMIFLFYFPDSKISIKESEIGEQQWHPHSDGIDSNNQFSCLNHSTFHQQIHSSFFSPWFDYSEVPLLYHSRKKPFLVSAKWYLVGRGNEIVNPRKDKQKDFFFSTQGATKVLGENYEILKTEAILAMSFK